MPGFLLKNSGVPSFSGDPSISEDQGIVADYYKSTRNEVANRLGADRAYGPADGAGLVFPNFAFLSGRPRH